MTTFLIDTCVLSETSKVRPHPNVVRFVEQANNLAIPLGALVEIHLGIARLCSRSPGKAIRLSAWYHELLAVGIPIAQTTTEVAEVWGVLAADARLQGLLVSRESSKKSRLGQDLHIAAAALVHRMSIATFNVKDFLLIDSCYPLPGIYDPLTNIWHARYSRLDWQEIGQEPEIEPHETDSGFQM